MLGICCFRRFAKISTDTVVLSDRLCIGTGGAVNVVLSPQDLLSCDTRELGCNGGHLPYSWAFLVSTGIVPDSCEPYTSGTTNTVPTCPVTGCQKYKASTYYSVPASNIQSEILVNGPVEAAFDVYRDFFQYSSGVYSFTSGANVGGHAIKIIGWGTDFAGTPYWIVQNSWGTWWGMNGFFWIKRGVNGKS